MKRTSLALVLSLLGSGCWTPPDDPVAGAEAPPPAAALTEISSTTPLDQGLAMLEAELGPVLEEDIDDVDRNARLFRAEAITDRLLETRLPFEWLSDNYGLDSRLRQIQALADRVIAQLRSSAPRDSLRADVTDLLTVVADLRTAIAEGGTRAPPPLEQLLSDFEANRRRPPPPRPPPAATPPDTTA